MPRAKQAPEMWYNKNPVKEVTFTVVRHQVADEGIIKRVLHDYVLSKDWKGAQRVVVFAGDCDTSLAVTTMKNSGDETDEVWVPVTTDLFPVHTIQKMHVDYREARK